MMVDENMKQQLMESIPEDMSFEGIKDLLRVQVMDRDSAKDRLSELVSKSLGNRFEAVPYLNVSVGDGMSGKLLITRSMAAHYHYPVAKLHETAMKNMIELEPPHLSEMEQTMVALLDPSYQPENLLERETLEDSANLFVLTHESREFGAAALFYPGVQEKVSKLLGGDYFVLPSSVHEVLVLPDNGDFQPEVLLDMVVNVNRTEVAPREVLGDRVLRYDSREKKLSICADVKEHAKDKGQEVR